MSDSLLNRWHTCKLANICKPVSRPISPELFKTYRLAGVRWYGQGVHISKIATGLELKTNQFDLVKAGDLTYNKMWTSKGAFGKVQPAHDGAIVTSEYPLFCVDEQVADTDFLIEVFKLPKFWKQAASLSRGSTSRTRLNPDDFLELIVLLPPLLEQHKITLILHSIDETITRTRDVLKQLLTIKQLVMEQLFTRGMGHTEFRQVKTGIIPKSWQIIELQKCAEIRTGVAKGRNLEGRRTIEVPYLRVANVQSGYLDLTEVKSIRILADELDKYRLKKGDVLLTEGGDYDKLGRGHVWNDEVPNCVHQNHIFSVRTDEKILLPEYLSLLCQSRYGRDYFQKYSRQTTNLATINKTLLGLFPVLIPPIAEQQQIVSGISAIDNRIIKEQAYETQLEQVKQALMQKLLSGEIRVTV